MNAIEELLRGHIRGSREAIAEAVSRVDALEVMVAKLGADFVAPVPIKASRNNGWSEDEDRMIAELYPKAGAEGCHTLLPHRSPTAIRSHASRLGVYFMPSAQRIDCAQCDARVSYGQAAACQSKFCKAKAVIAAGTSN